MPHRLGELEQPVSLTHDGTPIEAARGERLVLSLVTARGYVLSRSPKLHRPRGPYCLRGACEGCLVRVDGVANVMACQHEVRGGEQVETQNVLGSRELDLLGATDYLFPRGMDHHRMFAGVRGVSSLVQAFARRMSGLGRLPADEQPVRAGERSEVDVLIVGGGAAGLAAAAELGSRALLVDDQEALGGALALLSPERAAALIAQARERGARCWSSTTVAGLYREPEDGTGAISALVVGPERPRLLRCRLVIVAAGTHDASPLFENNDAPGVLSARAGLMMLSRGVAPGKRVALLGEGRFASAFAARSGSAIDCTLLDSGTVVRALGRPELRHVLVGTPQGERKLAVDALLFDAPGAPAFELAVQVGASVRFEAARGYVPQRSPQGEVAAGVFCAGSVAGAADSEADGRAVAQRLLEKRDTR